MVVVGIIEAKRRRAHQGLAVPLGQITRCINTIIAAFIAIFAYIHRAVAAGVHTDAAQLIAYTLGVIRTRLLTVIRTSIVVDLIAVITHLPCIDDTVTTQSFVTILTHRRIETFALAGACFNHALVVVAHRVEFRAVAAVRALILGGSGDHDTTLHERIALAVRTRRIERIATIVNSGGRRACVLAGTLDDGAGTDACAGQVLVANTIFIGQARVRARTNDDGALAREGIALQVRDTRWFEHAVITTARFVCIAHAVAIALQRAAGRIHTIQALARFIGVAGVIEVARFRTRSGRQTLGRTITGTVEQDTQRAVASGVLDTVRIVRSAAQIRLARLLYQLAALEDEVTLAARRVTRDTDRLAGAVARAVHDGAGQVHAFQVGQIVTHRIGAANPGTAEIDNTARSAVCIRDALSASTALRVTRAVTACTGLPRFAAQIAIAGVTARSWNAIATEA